VVAAPCARPPARSPEADPPAVVALVALLAARGGGADDELVRLLRSLRQARIMEVRAIEDYLGLRPARSERGRGVRGR
jgi:hypothetical protein